MARNNNNYFKSRQIEEERSGQRAFNLQRAVGEKFGVKDDWEVMNPLEGGEQPRKTESSYQTLTAPTTNPARPRAIKLAYDRSSETLVIKFRGAKGAEMNGPWIAYNNIPVDIWNDLKASNSTGLYLKNSGLDDQPWYNFNPADMPAETRVMFDS